jgi:hypothetical protein
VIVAYLLSLICSHSYMNASSFPCACELTISETRHFYTLFMSHLLIFHLNLHILSPLWYSLNIIPSGTFAHTRLSIQPRWRANELWKKNKQSHKDIHYDSISNTIRKWQEFFYSHLRVIQDHGRIHTHKLIQNTTRHRNVKTYII